MFFAISIYIVTNMLGRCSGRPSIGVHWNFSPSPNRLTHTKMNLNFIAILSTYHRIFQLVRRVSPCKRYPLCLPWPMKLTVSRCHWIKKQKRDRWNLPRLLSNTRRMTEQYGRGSVRGWVAAESRALCTMSKACKPRQRNVLGNGYRLVQSAPILVHYLYTIFPTSLQ